MEAEPGDSPLAPCESQAAGSWSLALPDPLSVPEPNNRMICKVDMTHGAREGLLERDKVWERKC